MDNQRAARSLQTTVLPEMRTRQPATELGVVFLLAGKKHGLGTNLFFFFFFFNCSVRNRTAVVTKHLGLLGIRKKIKDRRPNRKPRKDQARSQGGFGGCGRTPLFLRPKKKVDGFHRRRPEFPGRNVVFN